MNAAPDRKVFEEALQCCFNVIRSAELGKEKTIFAAWSGHAMKHTFQAGFDKVDAVDRLYEAGIAIGLDVSFIQDCLAEAVRFAENGADARAEDGGNAIGDRAIGTAIFSPLNVRSSEDFLTTNFPERESVLAPIFKTQALIMVAAYRGVGKTHFVLACGAAIASGSKFLKWIAPFARPVLYVDGEMPASDLQERLRGLSYRCDGRFRILSLDDQKLGVSLNLSRPEDQARIEAALGDATVLILDNRSTLVNSGRENDAESWTVMQDWLLKLRRRGISVILVEHAGRSGDPRGTSKREDVLDTVIHLRRPEDYRAEDGARFEVHLTKARGISGEAAKPFEAKLEIRDNTATWTTRDLQDVEADRVRELTVEGMSVRDISEETGMSKSKVNRLQAKLRAEGAI